MASADFSLRRSFLRRPPFKDEARSPQVRMVVFPAQPPDLRRSPLVARVRGQSSASPGSRRLVSGFCSSARGFCSPLLSAPASRPDRFPGFFALRFARGRCDQLPPGLSPVHHLHAGHTTKPLRGSPEASRHPLRRTRWLRYESVIEPRPNVVDMRLHERGAWPNFPIVALASKSLDVSATCVSVGDRDPDHAQCCRCRRRPTRTH